MLWVVTLLLVGVVALCGTLVVVGAVDDGKKGQPGTLAAIFFTSAVWACVVAIAYLWSRP
jgi:hypothetical protein